eukprot:TRINITY_DN6255_c0_g1_i5.p2 TRINITY_DN6255_c0_g1~~TRINITY_DN6255_c0_g1_i5.p2  ORF type:complete len:292 (-),score=74.25 TRINITY_DN6255_c0_g1_i5:113-988(-)
MFEDFGTLATNMKEYLEEANRKRTSSIKIESLNDMQRVLDSMPEIKKLSGNVSKHVALTCEVSRLIEEGELMDLSLVEQEIACSTRDNRIEHFRKVMEVLQNQRVSNLQKLKLVIIYALRYENDDKIPIFIDKLKALEVSPENLGLISQVCQFAGKNSRTSDLFATKDILAMASSMLSRAMKDVPNVYTQHKPFVSTLIEHIRQQKLRETDYPYTNWRNFRDSRPVDFIVFILGGATYEEAKEINFLNRSGSGTVAFLGGSFIHNSRTFLAEMSKFGKETRESTDVKIKME